MALPIPNAVRIASPNAIPNPNDTATEITNAYPNDTATERGDSPHAKPDIAR